MIETSGGFCMACGASSPLNAKFCPTCGVAQTAEGLEQLADVNWRNEFCDVQQAEAEYSGEIRTKWAFIARAVGSSGLFVAARSTSFKRDAREVWDAENEEALNGLIRDLSAEGWDPIDRGSAWFEYRFRREVEYEV